MKSSRCSDSSSPCGVRPRILDADQQAGRAAERGGERLHERYGAPTAHRCGGSAVGGGHRRRRRVPRRPVRFHHPRGVAFAERHLDVGAERGGPAEVVGEHADRAIGVLAGREPDRQLGADVREQRVRRLLDPGDVHPDGGDRRLHPEALEQGPAGIAGRGDALEHPHVAPEGVLVEVERLEPVTFVVRQRPNVVGEAGDGDRAAVVVEGREQPRRGRQRVRHRPAPHPRVHRLRERADVDGDIGHTSQRVGEPGPADLPVGQVGQHDDVGAQLVGVGGEEPVEVR